MRARTNFRKFVRIGIFKFQYNKKFAEKFELKFPLLADTKAEAVRLYEAKGIFLTKRISYLIDPEGKIAKSYDNVNPAIHAKEVIADLEKFLVSGQ